MGGELRKPEALLLLDSKECHFSHNTHFYQRSLIRLPAKREYGSTHASVLGRADRRKPKY
jgi:hypothetical protein